MNDKPTLRVAMKAVIFHDGKVLILREAPTYKDGTNVGKYHMPGGRIEPGENFETALRREVKEETGLEIDLFMPIYVGEWRPIIHDVPHQIIATFIVCKPKGDLQIILSEEHDRYEWIDPLKITKIDLMYPEDKVINRFAELLSNGTFS